MLASVNSSIARLLHERGGLPADEVEVSFRQPTQAWASSRVLPTVNCFLYALEEFTDLRNSAMQASVSAAGRVTQRMPPRRYSLRYQVTAWSSEPEDEHALLWRALATLARYSQLPDEMLVGETRASGLPFHARVGRPEEGPSPTELWSALSLPPRPALIYTVIVPLDLEIALDAPLVLSATVRTRRADENAPADRETLFVGGVVRDARGEPVTGALVALDGSAQESLTDTLGRYTLRIHRHGPARVAITASGRQPQVRTIVFDRQSAAFDITLD
jgi:hypothetical protein